MMTLRLLVVIHCGCFKFIVLNCLTLMKASRVELKKIRKAVFPVAGFGTRFLPATKAMPKELLPIIDKPLIQYAAEEAIAAGLDTLILLLAVTNVRLKIILIVTMSLKQSCV